VRTGADLPGILPILRRLHARGATKGASERRLPFSIATTQAFEASRNAQENLPTRPNEIAPVSRSGETGFGRAEPSARPAGVCPLECA
jgi:hypothetical protein